MIIVMVQTTPEKIGQEFPETTPEEMISLALAQCGPRGFEKDMTWTMKVFSVVNLQADIE